MFLADAKNITVNIFKHFPLDEDFSDCWEERNLRIRSEAEFQRVFTLYGSYPVKEKWEIIRFEDLIDRETYTVSSVSIGRI